MGASYGGVDMITGKTVPQVTPYSRAMESEIYVRFRKAMGFASHETLMDAMEQSGKLTGEGTATAYNKAFTAWLKENKIERRLLQVSETKV